MAAKTSKKTNGKAKKTKRAKKERVWCDAFMIPFKHRKLTPERALEWMREEYEGYHDLAMDAQCYATEQKDKDAFHNLAHGVARMVEACQAAIEAGEAVYLESDLQEKLKSGPYQFSTIKDYVRVLRFQQIVDGEVIITCGMHNALKALFDVTQRYMEAASEVEHEKLRAECRASRALRQGGEEERVIRSRYVAEKLERLRAKRNAVVDGLTAIAIPDLDREIEALEEERIKNIDRVFRPIEESLRSPEAKESERVRKAEVSRRLAAEGLAPAEAS